MASIRNLKDNGGNVFYPLTHERAVKDSNGVSLESKLAGLESKSYVEAWDGASTPVVANIPAGVVVTYNTTTYTGALAASASTVGKIYLVKDGSAYDRYITSQSGSTYSWASNGSTSMDLSGYATTSELNQVREEEIPNIPNLPIIPKIIRGEYIDQDGTIKSSASFKRTDKINVYFIEEIEITAPDGGSSYVCFLDKEMGLVENIRVEQGKSSVPVPGVAFYFICSYSSTATDWQFTVKKFRILGGYKDSYSYLGSNIRLSNYEDLQITQKYGNGSSYVNVDFGGGYIVFIDENGSSGWVGPLQSYTIPSNGYLYYNIKSKSVSVSQTILPLTENALLLECHYGYAISGVLPAMKYQSSQFSYEYNVRPVLRFAYYESISITRNGEASLTVNFGTGNLLYYFYGGSSLKQYFSLPSTDYVVPHNGYLYYNIADNTIEISNSQRFGYTDILLVNCHRGYPVQGWLTEIYVNTKTAREYSYSGPRVTIGQSNAFKVSKWKDIPFQTIMQGCAIYNNLLFVAGTEDSTSKFFIYNVDSGELVAKVANDPSLHYNTMYFSDEFPENGAIPYLYVNEWDGSRRICVYKFANDYTPTLVQTITVSNIDTSIIGSGQMDFGVDLGNKKLYTISYKNDVLETTGNSTIVCEFELLTISETTTINLTNEDVKRTFVLPFIYLRQQCLYENGKIYVLTSENYGYLCVIDVASATITNRIWLGADAKIHALPEVEGLFTYNYNAYVISYGDTGVYRLSF